MAQGKLLRVDLVRREIHDGRHDAAVQARARALGWAPPRAATPTGMRLDEQIQRASDETQRALNDME